MTDEEIKTVALGGRAFGVRKPKPGQWEALIRIQGHLLRGGDDVPNGQIIKQIGRLGQLVDALLASEDDVDTVTDLYIAGKVTSAQVVVAILTAWAGEEAAPAKPAKAVRVRK